MTNLRHLHVYKIVIVFTLISCFQRKLKNIHWYPVKMIWFEFLDNCSIYHRILQSSLDFSRQEKHIWCKYIGHRRITSCNQGHFFVFKEIKNTFSEKLSDKIFPYIDGQHLDNIFLLQVQKATNVKKLRAVTFGRSNKNLWKIFVATTKNNKFEKMPLNFRQKFLTLHVDAHKKFF